MLTVGELLESLERLIHFALRRGLLRRLLLHGLILIAQLVGLQFKQIGEVFGALTLLATAATTTTFTTAHLDLHVAVQRFGALHVLQRSLFRRQGGASKSPAELLLGRFHFSRCGFQLLLNFREGRIGRCHATVYQSLGK